ncbi:uncharacterized protein BJ212DRAFT_1298678 [Suillus subaureus]|uniref:Uncharacterized protein n=1 Tax=Suillus subaureus TaxID=48587 RepID=A0A9P7EDC8_9AGAM|nr:uncharacterized protein BJ212DRAFT_1298678 [Suillus subaureus]KAG1818607.1 hypothetical protein BJ212DRAFT_1298678 [Suillus subaureus]
MAKLLHVAGANKQVGTEGIKLWDTKSQKELTCSTLNHESWGTMQFQETCARRLGLGFEITCMSWDLMFPEASCISIQLNNMLNGDDGAVVKEYSCKLKRGMFMVDNAADGFMLYQLDGDKEPVQTFVTAAPSVSVPKQVAFGAEGRLVVGGSNNGLVYVFKRKLGQLLDTLYHSDTGLVQTITCMLTLLVHLSALVVTISFLIKNYFDTMVTWSIDLAEQMRPAHVFTFLANNLHQSVKVFQEVPDIQEECMHKKSDILMLHELAGKLMEVIQEVKRDVDMNLHYATEHDNIAAEAKRVFHQAVQPGQDSIRGI